MATVPVTKSAGSIPRFLAHIQDAGVPTKVTTNYLKSAGFKSSNDSALISVFKTLGFIDGSGATTERWSNYRNKDIAKGVLASAIREAYQGVFSLYPDAYRKDDEAIANWIRSNTTFAGLTITRAVKTFKMLCMDADFDAGVSPVSLATAIEGDTSQAIVPLLESTTARSTSSPSQPNVNINIELQLPSTNDPEVYENFFKAMKQHLFDEIK